MTGGVIAGADRYVEVNGLQIHYVEWPGGADGGPAGEPVLLVHGLTASARSLAGIAETLALTRGVVAPDLRGRGRSDKPREGYSFAHHTADLIALLDRLGIARVALVGHSLGALIGVYLAAHHPERVTRLVLIDAGADGRPELRAMLRSLVERLDLVYPSLPLFLAGARQLPSFQPWTRHLETALVDGLEVLPDGRVRPRTPRHVAEEEIASQSRFRLRALHGRIAAPTLILRAVDGLAPGLPPVLTPGEAAAIARAIPDARAEDIPANHYTIALNGRADVNARIATFLATGA
ncbi:MAG: alpha/beta hydrolase [Chloroflexota bacterium]|nr:alpha/beta hydrolase [Chloroflexota bacterium]